MSAIVKSPLFETIFAELLILVIFEHFPNPKLLLRKEGRPFSLEV